MSAVIMCTKTQARWEQSEAERAELTAADTIKCVKGQYTRYIPRPRPAEEHDSRRDGETRMYVDVADPLRGKDGHDPSDT